MSDRDGARDIYQIAIDDGGAPARHAAQRLTVGLNAHLIALIGSSDRLVCSVFSYRTNSVVGADPVDRLGGGPRATARATRPARSVDARPITTGNQIIESVDLQLRTVASSHSTRT